MIASWRSPDIIVRDLKVLEALVELTQLARTNNTMDETLMKQLTEALAEVPPNRKFAAPTTRTDPACLSSGEL